MSSRDWPSFANEPRTAAGEEKGVPRVSSADRQRDVRAAAEDACAGVRWAGKYGNRDRITGFVVTSRSRDGFRCSLVYFHTAHAPRLDVAHLKLDKGEVILDSAIAHIRRTATILEGMCTVNICLNTPIFSMCKITKNRLRGLL